MADLQRVGSVAGFVSSQILQRRAPLYADGSVSNALPNHNLGVAPGLDPGAHWRDNICMSYFVYILASRKRGTLYIGVTNDVARRKWQRRRGIGSKFAHKYRATRLVYVESHDEVKGAIQREKTMKEWPRTWKAQLIEKNNPEWSDLYEDINR